MSKNCEFSLSTFLLIFIIIHINIFILALTDENPLPPDLLVTRLIDQYRSIYSPYYDPKRTIKELAEIELRSSIARASSYSFHLADIRSRLSPSNQYNGFLVPLQVGKERIQQLVYMDTGSSMLWINCEPSTLEAPEPIYNPKESSTYEPSDCDESDYCDAIGASQVSCDSKNRCGYYTLYSSGFSSGHLAKETFVFAYRREEEVVRNIVFGCSHTTTLKEVNGILGLSAGKVSLLEQTKSSKFSYCLGRVSDIYYDYNTLIVGNRVKLLKNQIPMIVQGKYFMNLTSIKIGDTLLTIDPEILKRNPGDYTGGVVVDTGSTLSFLPRVAYDVFESRVINLVDYDMELERNFSQYDSEYNFTRLCYNGVLSREFIYFPIVEYEFEGGARMTFGAESIFQQVEEDLVCLALLPSELRKLPFSLLGSLMQQHYYVAFDFKAMKFSFERRDCSTIDDYIHDEL